METRDITIVKKYREGVTFLEALKLIPEGKRMISNKEADHSLQNQEEYNKLKDLFPCWTGQMLAYPARGEAFGKYIKDSYNKWIIDVPKEAQGLKGKALLIQKDIKIEITKLNYEVELTKVIASNITIIDFKDQNGWYLTNEFGIPNGEASNESNKEARYLYRRSEESLRPVSRWVNWYFDDRRDVNCGDYGYYNRLGVGVVDVNQAKSSSKEIEKKSYEVIVYSTDTLKDKKAKIKLLSDQILKGV